MARLQKNNRIGWFSVHLIASTQSCRELSRIQTTTLSPHCLDEPPGIGPLILSSDGTSRALGAELV